MGKRWSIGLLVGLVLAACTSVTEPTKEGKTVTAMPKSAKRGVAFSFSHLADLPVLSPYISWDYNWGNTPTNDAALWFDSNEMDYCPMCWNGSYNADAIRAYVAAHPNTKYLLGFNEPNLTDQANMTPKQAAELWPPIVALAKELKLQLVSPAMNYGTLAGYGDPIKWLDEFFAQPEVSLDDIDAIAIHCYMASLSGLQGFVQKFEKYSKPIWLTEFCAWDPLPGSVEVQMDYMSGVLNYLESTASIARYAWFIPRTNGKVDSPPYMQLLTHDEPPALTELGKMFCLFSSMDTTVWLQADRLISAHEYVKVANNAQPVRPSTDTQNSNGLMVCNFAAGQKLTYQLSLPAAASKITLRYCGYSNSICEVFVDGVSKNYVDMPRNGSTNQWAEASVDLPVSAGCHTIALALFSGNCYLSAFKIQ